MLAYHGTTKKALLDIIQKSTEKNNTSPWFCSESDNCTYVYPFNKICESECLDENETEYVEERALSFAFDSAKIQNLFCDTKDTEIFAIVFDIPDELLEDDYSCPSMESVASF